VREAGATAWIDGGWGWARREDELPMRFVLG
jgi:hypothetical protein